MKRGVKFAEPVDLIPYVQVFSHHDFQHCVPWVVLIMCDVEGMSVLGKNYFVIDCSYNYTKICNQFVLIMITDYNYSIPDE